MKSNYSSRVRLCLHCDLNFGGLDCPEMPDCQAAKVGKELIPWQDWRTEMAIRPGELLTVAPCLQKIRT